MEQRREDRLASHEWGHIIGFGEVPEASCPLVETIMRQFSANNTIFDNQLKGTEPLPAPGRPNACDACAAKDKQAGVTLGTSCPTPTPTPSPSPTPTPSQQAECESQGMYWNSFTNTCGFDPPPPQCGLIPLYPCEEGTSWSSETCECEVNPSPIVIDVAGNGFNLTDGNGV